MTLRVSRGTSHWLTSACPHRAIVGIDAPGVLAERVALPAHFAHPAPDGLTGAVLAATEPYTVATEPYTVARAAVRRSGVTAADRCPVVGAGAQGLLVCPILSRLGIRPMVTEPHPQRLARAGRLGATPDDGRTGFTHVFETSGHAPALRPAVDRCAAGATIVLIGLAPHHMPLTTDDVVRRQLVLRGSMIYDHPGDFTTGISTGPRRRSPAPPNVPGRPGSESGAMGTGARRTAIATMDGRDRRPRKSRDGHRGGTGPQSCPLPA
ncbi:zinc-binding dehydrogenase [Streptomyces sp. SD31]|uniref:zinc-binding dehydrogenase n=1 Tax=Streptomyces sp. SD31 TaxID=3452208 RepID=UPI003F8A537D